MAITIRSLATGTNNGSTTSVAATTAISTAVDDVLLILHSNNFYNLSNMQTPTVTPSTSTVAAIAGGTADAGANLAHFKTYTCVVDVGGAQVVTATETGTADEEKALAVYVLTGVNTTTPTDGAAGAFGPSTPTEPAPSVSPTTSDALLVCATNSGGGSSTASYTSPASMTEQYEFHVGGLSGVGATEQLTASGATGTRTFTPATDVPWAAVSIAVRAAGAAFVAPSRYLVATYAPTRASHY